MSAIWTVHENNDNTSLNYVAGKKQGNVYRKRKYKVTNKWVKARKT